MKKLSYIDAGMVPPMVICDCWAFLTWMLDVFLPWLDISVEEYEDLHGGYAYNQHEKGTGSVELLVMSRIGR